MLLRLGLPVSLILGVAAIFALGWLQHSERERALQDRAARTNQIEKPIGGLNGAKAQAGQPGTEPPTSGKWPQLSISGLVLVACLFMVISRKYKGAEEHWAFGTIGLVLGYWLKSP